jgi:hypothetical protein
MLIWSKPSGGQAGDILVTQFVPAGAELVQRRVHMIPEAESSDSGGIPESAEL